MQYMQRTIMLIVLSWNMKKGTEAFKMIILRLSDSNCVRMPEYILSFKVKTVCARIWFFGTQFNCIGEKEIVHMFRHLCVFGKHVVPTTKVRCKRQMSNISNFVTYFYFVDVIPHYIIVLNTKKIKTHPFYITLH